MLIQLTYERQSDEFHTVKVIGSPKGIRDLYWQLTHNYKAQDGTRISNVKVIDLDGHIIQDVMVNPYQGSYLDTLPD